MTTDDALDPDDEAQGDPVETVAPRPPRRARHTHKKHLPVWQESILLLVIALGLAIVIKAFFVQAFYIPSASMHPGLVENDRILVEKPSYWFGGSPQRGDVIVFSDPGGWLSEEEDAGPTGFASVLAKIGLYPTGGHLVKRVIGVPGDTIHCCSAQGQLEINGHAIDEDGFLSADAKNAACDAKLLVAPRRGTDLAGECNWTIGPVPAGKLFVMGDNRTNSADSRQHMCSPSDEACTSSPWVPESTVVGKVFAVVWPKSRWTWVSRPDVFKDVPDPS
ncbi:signal peptidase I [Nocardioides ultimimeridianus]